MDDYHRKLAINTGNNAAVERIVHVDINPLGAKMVEKQKVFHELERKVRKLLNLLKLLGLIFSFYFENSNST